MMTRAPHSRFGVRAVRRAAAAAAAGTVLLVAGCGGDGGVSGGYTVRAIFDSASFITNGLDVKISGVTVGTVSNVDLTPDNQAAVTFVITRPGFQDLRKDAHCTIRPQALIGERYIECDLTQIRPDGATPPPALPEIQEGPYKGEHLLPVDNTSVPVDSDQVLNVNDSSVSERVGIIIRELGAGVAGRGDEIGRTLAKSNDGLRYANQILAQLDNQQEMLKQLVSSSDQTLESLATERASLTGTVENGAVVARRLAARKNELKGTIASLNQLITEVPPSVDRVTQLTDELQPIADDLNKSSGELATILNLLPDVAKRGTEAVTSLGPVVDKGRTILTSAPTNTLFDRLTSTSGAAKASLGVLGLTLGDFRTTGGLDYLLDTIYGLAYSTNGRDANGSYLRGALINVLNCALPDNVSFTSCGTRLNVESTGLAAAKSSTDAAAASVPSGASSASSSSVDDDAAAADTTTTSKASGTTPETTTPDVTRTSAELLLGGTQ